MLTLDHYAYNIRNIARGGQGNSDDERINIRQIRFWINGYRASGMFETTDFGKDIHPQLIQDLGIVPLTEVDKSDSECPKVDWGCTIKKVKIPKLIDFPDLRALSYVGYISKQGGFIINHPDQAILKSKTKFGNLKSRVYPIGDYLYFILSDNDSELEYVNIRGVFENPEDVVTYPTAGCEQKCYNPGADEYPMPRRLYEYVLTKVLRNELNWTTQAINDELNNARLDNAKIR
jgi:hypothetical protein